MAQIKWYISVYIPIPYLSKYFDSENKSFIEFTLWATKQGYFRDWDCFELSNLTKNPGFQIIKSYQLMRRLAHYAVYNISITGVIVLSSEIIFNIILMRVWHTISSFKLDFKRGQGCLPYIPLLPGNRSCYVIHQKSNQISKNR